MLKTKEEIKKAVLDYLVNSPSKTKQVENYTLSRISEAVQMDVSKVKEALEELKNDNLVDSREVQLDVYVPKNQDGSKVLTFFAAKGFITYSPYWAVLLGIMMLFIGFSVWGHSLSLPAETTTLIEAYLMGIRNGIVGSFIIGWFGGYIIHEALGKFRRWQLVSEEDYETISSLLKYSFYIFVVLGISYYIISNQLGYRVELTSFLVLLGVSVASAFSYEGIKRKKKT
ncbi:MAG: hypothetical protein A2W22_06755 [Candidatus Levybacteria bacterium RBG_16_35_11]|nr:MAG: hypothetical protein A2W22_06755 [Candidatus Levybacteria bacterium RBG_16_35_11]